MGKIPKQGFVGYSWHLAKSKGGDQRHRVIVRRKEKAPSPPRNSGNVCRLCTGKSECGVGVT